MCESDLADEENHKSLMSMKNNVTPGSDGLTTEFYKFFWHLFGPTFSQIVRDTFDNNNTSLIVTQREGIIRLICKDKKNKDDLKFYRPISLLNTDYKIIAKTLANRLKCVLPHIIHPDQSYGIPGRTIQDNIIFTNAMFSYIEQKNIPAIYLNIDQEKAFDRVPHQYLFETIEKFGFGNNFIKWIKILYNSMTSKDP